ncbi:MAG: hypothetical protein CM1200mP40_04530 [Gammaproteobacteria bacterium]|nr:MAG: hypothetical protein CM1200mP40_04530 [Gammaproteobacteria bacterium]
MSSTLLAGSLSSPVFAAVSLKYGGLPMGIHGASFREFDIEETLRIIVEELGLNEIELTSSQIRLHGDPEHELATLGEVRSYMPNYKLPVLKQLLTDLFQCQLTLKKTQDCFKWLKNWN